LQVECLIEVAFRPVEVEVQPSVVLDAAAMRPTRTALGESSEPAAAAVYLKAIAC